MNIKEVQKLISFVADSGALEFKLNFEEVKIVIKKNTEDKNIKTLSPLIYEDNVVPQVDNLLQSPIRETQRIEEIDVMTEYDSKFYIVKSTFIGTVFLQSSFDGSGFLKIGNKIEQGDLLCKIEALKLPNEVRSNVSGKIEKILIENFSPVDYNQSLFVISI